jgi:hypothetical protein
VESEGDTLVRFTASEIYVIETLHEYTLTRIHGKRQKRFFEKKFAIARESTHALRSMQVNSEIENRIQKFFVDRDARKRRAIRRDARAMRVGVRKTVQ